MGKTRQLLKTFLSALLVMMFIACVRGQEVVSRPAAEGTRISESVRIVAYPEAFYGHAIMPDWDRGYVLNHEIEMNSSPNAAMVVMYDATGKRVREGRIWPQGAGYVTIRRTAATHDGAILAGGGAIMQDGSISAFIVKTDLAGNTIQSVATGTFHPEQLCEAPDGTVWSLGSAFRPDNLPVADTEVVRHYSFEKGLLNSFLPETTVRALLNSSEQWFSPFGSFLRCGKEKVSLYLEFTDEYAEIDNSSFALTRWKLDQNVVQQRKANGLAVTDDGKVYASFSAHGAHGVSGPYGLTSLYQVEAKPGNPVARLLPIGGTVDAYGTGDRLAPGVFIWLWGAKGNQLAIWRADERDVSWVNILSTGSTD